MRTFQRLMFLAMIAAVSPAVAGAQEPEASTFATRLDDAKALYFSGDLPAGQEALQRLQLEAMRAPDAQEWSDVVEALTYLGEILVKLGDEDGAQRVFRHVLERDPTTAISPYHHPIEVVFLFNRVREIVTAENEASAPVPKPPPPPPATTYLPLGIPQLAQKRVGAAVLYGGGQVLLGGVAIGTFIELRAVNQAEETHPRGWTEDQILSRVQVRRYGVQWPTTIGFYTLWALSAVDANRSWRKNHSVGLLPGAGHAPGLTLVGRL